MAPLASRAAAALLLAVALAACGPQSSMAVQLRAAADLGALVEGKQCPGGKSRIRKKDKVSELKICKDDSIQTLMLDGYGYLTGCHCKSPMVLDADTDTCLESESACGANEQRSNCLTSQDFITKADEVASKSLCIDGEVLTMSLSGFFTGCGCLPPKIEDHKTGECLSKAAACGKDSV